MFQFKVKNSVVEVRDTLQKMVVRGLIEESMMIEVTKKFSEEKKKVQEGQRFITIMV